MNPAVFEGRAVLGQAEDEQPHVVLLPTPQAEPEAPGAALQLHWVAAQALQGEKSYRSKFSQDAEYILRKD